MEQDYKLYLEVLVLCVIYSLRVLSKLSVDLTTLYIFFFKRKDTKFPLTTICPHPDVIDFSHPPPLSHELGAACRQSPSILCGLYYLDG